MSFFTIEEYKSKYGVDVANWQIEIACEMIYSQVGVSYRNPNWKTNDKGRRLDHIWITKNLEHRVISSKILKEFRAYDRPSDHVPVLIEIQK